MADNIKLRKANFTTNDGYFFTFDEDQDALLQKTDDGNTAFSYPLDTVLTNTVKTCEFDGVYFWSLEEPGDVLIKRWKIDNYVCKLQETFTMSDSGSHTYSVETFTVEHYHTTITSTVSGGSTTILIDKYSDVPDVIDGTTLYLGPNTNGEYEEATVSGTVYGGVVVSSPITYDYATADEVNFHKHLWLLNNYNGTSSATGALYKFDSHTGLYMTKYAGGQYKDVTASTFYTVDSFIEHGPVDTLVYIKGTNSLYVNTSEDIATLTDASDYDDTFTGANGSAPNSSNWDIREGTPDIQNNSLYFTTTSGSESITSDYYLRGNFEVTISGALATYPTYSGVEYYAHGIGLLFPNQSDRYCYAARANNNELRNNPGQENFNVTSYKATTTVPVSTSATISGVPGYIDNYYMKMSRAGSNVSFYYQPVTSGIAGNWNFLGTVAMFDDDCRLMLHMDNTTNSSVETYFDSLSYVSGEAVYFTTATQLPYYGSMVMENILADQATVIAVYDLTMDAGNMYRLQSIEDGGGGMSGYNYQLSPLDSFVTSISLSASPAIIAANGLSTSDIQAVVKDQFLQPISGRRVTFSENGDGSITGGTQINTNSDGEAQTEYQAGTTAQEVTITAVVEQTN